MREGKAKGAGVSSPAEFETQNKVIWTKRRGFASGRVCLVSYGIHRDTTTEKKRGGGGYRVVGPYNGHGWRTKQCGCYSSDVGGGVRKTKIDNPDTRKETVWEEKSKKGSFKKPGSRPDPYRRVKGRIDLSGNGIGRFPS